MKTLTTICLLTVLLCTALILAQGFSEKERPAKRTPLLPSSRVREA